MSPRISFLLSAPYSGATLLSILANQHPKISSDGEIFPYTNRAANLRCSCRQYQIKCPYYRHVASSMIKSKDEEFDGRYFYYVPQYSGFHLLSRAFEGFWINPRAHRIRNFALTWIPRFRNREREFTKIQMSFFTSSLLLRNAEVYFDGTKSLRRAEFFAERNLATNFVHLIRDGRAFCCSFLKNKKLGKGAMPASAMFWKENIRKVRVLQQRFPSLTMHIVRYNDLCREPGKELARFYDFFGLDYQESYMNYRADDMHILGNRMRFEYDGIIKEDNAWKTFFSNREIEILNDLMRAELEFYSFI
ncbi:MAG: hypothetical protein CVU57_12835 [Deltaproteobacteria bacterium HGW-Deltaproteobacteria-15]|jgi:hypothetical protein|nr:MAG: hypothetical protein CVU57_12835 [Deltaproteobacteria bacterium HGW-Deltaproteobacteria-15]